MAQHEVWCEKGELSRMAAADVGARRLDLELESWTVDGQVAVYSRSANRKVGYVAQGSLSAVKSALHGAPRVQVDAALAAGAAAAEGAEAACFLRVLGGRGALAGAVAGGQGASEDELRALLAVALDEPEAEAAVAAEAATAEAPRVEEENKRVSGAEKEPVEAVVGGVAAPEEEAPVPMEVAAENVAACEADAPAPAEAEAKSVASTEVAGTDEALPAPLEVEEAPAAASPDAAAPMDVDTAEEKVAERVGDAAAESAITTPSAAGDRAAVDSGSEAADAEIPQMRPWPSASGVDGDIEEGGEGAADEDSSEVSVVISDSE